MFDFEHPFARNELPTLREGTNDQVLLTIRDSYYSCMEISHFLHFRFSTLLPQFEVFSKKLWWPVPPLWWPLTNHEATPCVVFAAFIFVHLVVVHSNLVMEQKKISKKSLM
jgi:hypothetical protein